MSSNESWLKEVALDNASAPDESSVYRIANYTATTVIAIISSGTLNIQVSNDGTNFVTHSSLTSDGYVVLRGFAYVKFVVDSGTIDSAVMLSQRRYSIHASDTGEKVTSINRQKLVKKMNIVTRSL